MNSMKNSRLEPSRFSIGDRVVALATMRLRFSGRLGIVVAVSVSPFRRTLDKYRVRLEGYPESVELFDIELSRAAHVR